VTEQIQREALKKARRMVAEADSRRLVARLISTKQRISQTQLCMVGVKVNLAKVGYRLHPNMDLDYIVPVEAPKTKQQLVEEMVNTLSGYSLRVRNIPRGAYQKIRHNGRLIRRMVSSGAT